MLEQHSSKINFGAGPAALPPEVLIEASKAILNYNDSGLSILEIAHRGDLFDNLLEESKQLVLELTGLNADEYEVLWLQGGGRMQFAMIPMNFLAAHGKAGYIDSGHWAFDAQSHAKQYGQVVTLASSRAENYRSLPLLDQPIPSDLSYVHLTTNNTIYGTQLRQIPDCSVPLFADMSSDIFSEQRDYSRYDLFYAVAQKNLGAAGVTLVVIRKSMQDKIVRQLSPILDYQQQIRSHSVLNTPPVFSIYVALLTLRWISNKSIAAIEKENDQKAAMLYQEIERNSLFEPIVETTDRSKMNVVFRAYSQDIGKEFLIYCEQNGIEGVAGHRSVGGFRVSLYNAITVEQVAKFVTLLHLFEQEKLKQ